MVVIAEQLCLALGLRFSSESYSRFIVVGDWEALASLFPEPSLLSMFSALLGSPQPLTSLCRCCGVSSGVPEYHKGEALTFRASLREKAFSQVPQGKGLTLRWILV